MPKITLWSIIKAFKFRIGFTAILVILDAALMIAYPAAIGYAVDQLLENNTDGLILLGSLGIASLLIGSFRRFYDTRIYAKMYADYAPKLLEQDSKNGVNASTSNARVSLLQEFFDFLEESMPETVNIIIGIVGVGIMISQFNLSVFYACLGLLLLIFLVFAFSANWNYQFNAGFNSQLEKQVNIIAEQRSRITSYHFNKLMQWRIKLSDLETANYFIIWLGIIALMLYAPYMAVADGENTPGGLLSLMVYVFQYIDNVVLIPLLFQQLIRLQEISHRLSAKQNGKSLDANT